MISQLSILDIGQGLHVRRIEYQDAIPFLKEIHYARRVPNITDAFGLFLDNEMIGVVTYGIPASKPLCIGLAGVENQYNVKELNRLVIKPEYNQKRERERILRRISSHIRSKCSRKVHLLLATRTQPGRMLVMFIRRVIFFIQGLVQSATTRISRTGYIRELMTKTTIVICSKRDRRSTDTSIWSETKGQKSVCGRN